ncbi:glycerol-3-phosphate dehydrogenase/oxidase [Nesterenkonia aerolata]|uniref:Glycerol-3-phosphate dehydrogenase n=1 Tax=Nesterenkonia aerolata TaxID=3074079 RepID=A0ABU2DQC7_9MICC|nr:glycerol-3-phosphate dehydrogenase/oxidase [Nesterenkonia sp. LY-0111]MDR8018709.1 glycerol-3-phosphate dehydrogenase/oxidase [Nesterenkonia sp. LY-0111]
MRPQPLNAEARARAVERFAQTTADEPLDVLVIGGGVVGAGAAFDAATRGLEVGLVEAEDFAQGTSSRSSGLVHGGLRYLQMLDFKLVHEALRERDLLLRRTAPHLVRALPFVFPFEKHVLERAFVGSGVSLYDALSLRGGAASRAVPFHRHLSRGGLRQRIPGLDGERFIGGLEYHDAQVDDARLVLTLARSAHCLGAHLSTGMEATEYLRDAAGRVIGAALRDRLTGEEHRVYARETITALGVWTTQAEERAGTESGLRVLASKGIHITVPKERIAASGRVGVISQTEKSVLFLIPLRDCWAIGTTDTSWQEAVDAPAPTAEDIDYVLEHANEVLGEDLTREDVWGTWAGLRPLVQPLRSAEGGSSKVSREHTVVELAPGLTGVAGGKLTTYRVMAEDVVDFALDGSFRDRPSLTAAMPLLGAQGYGEWVERAEEIARRYGWAPERVERLLERYGSLLGEVLALISADPGLGEPLSGAPRHLRAEIVYAAEAEAVGHLDDVLTRRTRLFQESADRGAGAVDEVLEILAARLGWDARRVQQEREHYLGLVRAQIAAESSDGDAEAARQVAQARGRIASVTNTTS